MKQPSANISFCPICDCMTKDILNSGEIWCGKCKLVKTKQPTPMIDLKGHNLIVEELKRQHVQELKDQKAKIRDIAKKEIERLEPFRKTKQTKIQYTMLMDRIDTLKWFLKEFEELM